MWAEIHCCCNEQSTQQVDWKRFSPRSSWEDDRSLTMTFHICQPLDALNDPSLLQLIGGDREIDPHLWMKSAGHYSSNSRVDRESHCPHWTPSNLYVCAKTQWLNNWSERQLLNGCMSDLCYMLVSCKGWRQCVHPKWHPIPYVVHYCWPGIWSKVVYRIGNRLSFGALPETLAVTPAGPACWSHVNLTGPGSRLNWQRHWEWDPRGPHITGSPWSPWPHHC